MRLVRIVRQFMARGRDKVHAYSTAWLGSEYSHLGCGRSLRLRLVEIRGRRLQPRPGYGRGPAPPRPLAAELPPRGHELLRTHHLRVLAARTVLLASDHHLTRVRKGLGRCPHARPCLGSGTLAIISRVVRVLTHQPRARAPPAQSAWVVLPVEPFTIRPDHRFAVDVAPAAVSKK